MIFLKDYIRIDILSILQLGISILFFYYSYTECNNFYCFLTGRKGIQYMKQDLLRLLCSSHQEITDTGMALYAYHLVSIMGKKIFIKIHQHFVHSASLFAQKAVGKYTENLMDICVPNFHSGKVGGNGWYGSLESVIRLFVRPTEMGYCFLDSNRLFNSFLTMEMEKYFLQFKISLVTISSSICISIPMCYRALTHLLPFRSFSRELSQQNIEDLSLLKIQPRRKRKKSK
jgi:hypothetical protein